MPYVPSEKTDGKSQDRVLIDAKVDKLAKKITKKTTRNLALNHPESAFPPYPSK